MATVRSRGASLFYEKWGSGSPMLLMHSSACTGGLWQGLTRHLGDGFTFFTPDLAGYGRSTCAHTHAHTGLREEADFISPLLAEDDEPFHLIGHSFGGAVALTAALAWPERVKSLVLYEPTVFSVLRHRDVEARRLFEGIVAVQADMQELIDAGFYERAMGRFVDFWNAAGSWSAKPRAERRQLSTLAPKIVEDFRMLFDFMRQTILPPAELPVLILCGDQSPTVATRVAQVLAGLMPTARLFILSGAGHMAPVTHPNAVAPAILEHVLVCDRLADFQSSTANSVGYVMTASDGDDHEQVHRFESRCRGGRIPEGLRSPRYII